MLVSRVVAFPAMPRHQAPSVSLLVGTTGWPRLTCSPFSNPGLQWGLQVAPVLLIGGWCLETKSWTPGVLVAAGYPWVQTHVLESMRAHAAVLAPTPSCLYVFEKPHVHTESPSEIFTRSRLILQFAEWKWLPGAGVSVEWEELAQAGSVRALRVR